MLFADLFIFRLKKFFHRLYGTMRMSVSIQIRSEILLGLPGSKLFGKVIRKQKTLLARKELTSFCLLFSDQGTILEEGEKGFKIDIISVIMHVFWIVYIKSNQNNHQNIQQRRRPEPGAITPNSEHLTLTMPTSDNA